MSNASNNGVYTNNNSEDEGNRWSITLVSDETFSSEAAIAKIGAEASATYVTSIDGFSNDYLYTFISNRSTTDYLMYASSITSDYVVSNYKYSGLSVGHDIEACQWAVYKSDNGYYYMYNVGAGKFMGTATGGDASIPFSETPQTTDLIFKASSVTTHPIMISTNGGDGTLNRSDIYGYGAINWDNDFGNTDDAGNVNKVRQVAEIGAELKATIANLVSAFEFNAVYAELKTLIEEVRTCIDGANQGVGTITTESANTLSTAVTTAESVTNSNTYSEIVSATTTLQSAYDAAEYICPESGKYYILQSAATNDYCKDALAYASVDDNCVYWSKNYTGDNVSAIWQFETVDGGYNLKNVLTGAYFGDGKAYTAFQLGSTKGTVTLSALGDAQLNVITNGSVLHAQNSGSEVVPYGGDKNSASAWKIVEVENPGVAVVGDKGYATLAEAITASTAGQTVTLLADATGAGLVIKKNVTIDFNGKTYTVNSAVGSTGTETLAFQVLAGANAAAYDVTFKNGTIAVTDAVVEGSKALKVVIMNYSNLTLEGMTINGTGSSAMQYGVATNNGKLTLDGETTIEVADGVCALDIDGSQNYYGAVTAEIGENVTINGDVAIYGEDATVAITQGTFNGDFSIDETAGVTITGGTFANNTDEDVLLHLPLGYQLVQADGEDDFTATNTGESDLVRIVDGAGAYENTADVPVGELRYVRTFGHTDWQVLYVPFAIPVENMNGIEVYSISSVADDVVMVDKLTEETTLAAHTPYLIKANTTGEKTITVENATLKAVPETAGKIELGNGYTFTGTYAPMDATALSGSYVLTGVMENEVVTSAQWRQLDAESTAVLGAFRVYLTVPTIEAGAPSLRIATRGETGTTSIDNAQLTNDNEAVIYDLTGRRVEKMEKGIYIVNGKKVVIR